MKSATKFAPAFTLRSAIGSLLAMLGTAALIQYVHVVLAVSSPGEHALVIPGLWVLLALIGGCSLLLSLFKLRILTQAELLCILYTVLISGPMMAQGFWHRVVSISSTIPRSGDFQKMDAFSYKFWPAGDNLLQNYSLHNDDRTELTGSYQHALVDASASQEQEAVVLENDDETAISSIRFKLPVKTEDLLGVMPGTPYLTSILLRTENMAAGSHYFVRFYSDESSRYREAIYSRVVRPPTAIHPNGYQREGVYDFKIPVDTHQSITMEVGLEGTGRLYVTDPQLRSVLAMEQIFTGRKEISEEEFSRLPDNLRHGYLVRPDNMLSLAGLKYTLSGYIPWDAWWRPILTWGSLLTLILLGTLSIAVIMRRKWIDSERFALPLTRIPTLLLGEPNQSNPSFLTDIWRSRAMWIGFSLCLVWCLLKIFSFYNTAIPDPSINIPLDSYFGPEWGKTWNVTFSVFAVFVSLAIFVELNILISFVIGFFMFRLLYWYGHVSGMDANPGFPYAQEQQVGAYLSYAVLILWFTRKYLRDVLKEACTANPPARGEIFSYRTALLLLLGVFLGSALWANWVNLSIGGILIFMTFLLTIGFVAMRIRAECGVPWGYFTPNNAALIIMMTGGIGAFGPQLVVFTFVASFFLTVAGFFLIPGAQLELIELGRRYGIRPKHILGTCLFGIFGGLLIGGWAFLSSSYAFGGDSMRLTWAYEAKEWYFTNLNQELAQANMSIANNAGSEAQTSMSQSSYGYLYGAAGAGILTLLRQIFAGFWLHPIGFILGSTHVMGAGGGALWGSFLAAWFIRLVVVKLGGAETVRTKLLPFFAGVFLASVLALLLNAIYATYLRANGVENIFIDLL